MTREPPTTPATEGDGAADAAPAPSRRAFLGAVAVAAGAAVASSGPTREVRPARARRTRWIGHY